MTRQIPFFDGHSVVADMQPQLLAAVQRVLESGQFILGTEVAAFEQEFAAFAGARFAIAVASGTDALILALKAVKVTAGDTVITVPNTAPATAAAIVSAGCKPRFVDVHPQSLLMCPSLLRYELQRPARAIIPVHLYGQPVQLDDIILAARQSGAAVIEDCAHAHGAFDNGLHAGLQGDIGCFSFYPTKPLGAAGDGGICITNSEQLAQRLRTLRMYGFDDRRICTEPGLNSRLDEIQAAILRQKLPRILSQQQHRQKLASLYLSQLQQIGIPTPAIRSSITHSWHQFVVRVPQRRLVQHRLAELGIGTAIHYEHCLHLMPAFSGQCTAGSYPFAEQAAAEVLSLPCSGHVTESDVEHIVEALAKCLP